MKTALYTHHHYGWRKHDLPNSYYDHLVSALIETHGFLADFEGKYGVEVERTPQLAADGVVRVYWASSEECPVEHIRLGDIWFRAFDFNVAPEGACRFCGGTGMDHYVGPFFHCWACDGAGHQVRESKPLGFIHKPTKHTAAPDQNPINCPSACSGGDNPGQEGGGRNA